MAKNSSSSVPILLLIVAILATIYVYPRILISTFGEASPWTSYLYMYGFGAIFFSIGIALILKTGSCKPGRGNDSYWLTWLLGGFIFFATLHGVWIYLALTTPYVGGGY